MSHPNLTRLKVIQSVIHFSEFLCFRTSFYWGTDISGHAEAVEGPMEVETEPNESASLLSPESGQAASLQTFCTLHDIYIYLFHEI